MLRDDLYAYIDMTMSEERQFNHWKAALKPSEPGATEVPKEPAAAKEPVTNTRHQFTEPMQQTNIKLPADLMKSIKIEAFQRECTMGEIILECLTSQHMIQARYIALKPDSKRRPRAA